ncbi:MAG: M15 family metallopeptidase [Holdemanella porci]
MAIFLVHYTQKDLTNHQINNRKTLRNLMLDNGFIPLESEWWHYTLKDEPYPDTYFNVEVKSDGN